MSDETFMRRAIELALEPEFTSPNPRVGAVLVRDGKVIGAAAHEGPGHPHAEAVALRAAGDARGATCYVTLEPCAHHGRTPPCAPALVDAGVEKVVAAIEDPDDRVAGEGFAYLRSNGVAVTVGVLAQEAADMNVAYLHQRRTGRPLVTLKLALTLDGRLAARDGSSTWITQEEARVVVHARRQEVDAVMVGAGTVVADDPALTVRNIRARRQPARVVVDSSGRTAPTAAVFDAGAEVIVVTTDAAAHDRQTAWKEAGAEVVVLPRGDDSGIDLDALVDEFGRRSWLEVMCEGGGELATTLLRRDLVDRLELFYGGVVVGSGGPAIGDIGVSSIADARRFRLVTHERLGNDVRVVYENVRH
ncbi:MAG: bifunctional diaminohydroxyphosphoribosylaminopyrimidine deaminase/5-amino-6-(5-phosphoribosylamino)uracil reductase RibD [Actinobacteria bacterium]|nr:bifunctional diaminohydroxyphosphoribosylaminopyrimidine deaminase/5-amino-6-(5-phosphoribosylamino)uracil reductase RibD [Actinomycetota bacterium]